MHAAINAEILLTATCVAELKIGDKIIATIDTISSMQLTLLRGKLE